MIEKSIHDVNAKSWRASLYRKSKTDRQRLFRVPWTTRRLSQSILREINPEEDIGQTDAEAPKLWPPHVKS